MQEINQDEIKTGFIEIIEVANSTISPKRPKSQYEIRQDPNTIQNTEENYTENQMLHMSDD